MEAEGAAGFQILPLSNKVSQQINKDVCHLSQLLALHLCSEQNGWCFTSAFQISCKFLLKPILIFKKTIEARRF